VLAKKLKIERQKKKVKWNLFSNLDEVFDNDLLGKTYTEIFSNKKLNIDGCVKVNEYTDTYIKLKLQRGNLIICGSEMQIVFFENNLITVKGELSSIEFCV